MRPYPTRRKENSPAPDRRRIAGWRMKRKGEEMGGQQMDRSSSMKRSMSGAEGNASSKELLPAFLLGTPEEEAPRTGHHKWPCLCKSSMMTVPSKTPRTPACLAEANGRVLHSEPVAATGGWARAAWPCSKVYKGVQGSCMRGQCRGSLRCSSQGGSRSKGQWQRPPGTQPGPRSRPALIPTTVARNTHQQCLMGTNPGSRGVTLQKRPARLRGSTRTSHTPAPNPWCQLKASRAGMRML